jgi:NAD/NADP transhydrogenase beta subunit
MRDTLIQLAYLLAALLFLIALRALGKPDTARRGMQLAAFGMAVGIAATLLNARIVSYGWILVGSVIGAVAGYPLGKWVPMTAMPQRIALSHALGALAATLVGVGEYYHGFSAGDLGNVLLAEAGVPYDKLVDMEDINEKFAETDVALVVGANDVVNPASKTNPKSPIYGMPILKVAEARSVIALKRGRGAGFSGVENDLFVDPETSMLFGDAKQSLITLGLEVKNA